KALYNQLFLDATTHSKAYTNPVDSITVLIHGAISLTALRDQANKISLAGYSFDGVGALKYLTGLDLKATGPIVDITQANPDLSLIKGLFNQLFQDGVTRSPAYAKPVQ